MLRKSRKDLCNKAGITKKTLKYNYPKGHVNSHKGINSTWTQLSAVDFPFVIPQQYIDQFLYFLIKY